MNKVPQINQIPQVPDQTYVNRNLGMGPQTAKPLDENYFHQNFNTPLSGPEQAAYRLWLDQESARRGRDMSGDSIDYDLQGWWKQAQGRSNDNARGHFPDKFKKPNHPTFSDQSQYHGTPSPFGKWEGGQWGNDGVLDTYTPSKAMLENTHPEEFLRGYMKRREPNVRLKMPQ